MFYSTDMPICTCSFTHSPNAVACHFWDLQAARQVEGSWTGAAVLLDLEGHHHGLCHSDDEKIE